MKIYTKSKDVNYNALIQAISQTGENINAYSFEDTLGLMVDKTVMSYMYGVSKDTFFIRTDEIDEVTGLWVWESVEAVDQLEYKNGTLYDLDNGYFVFNSAHDRYGYFDDVYSIDDYIESL